MTIQMTTDPPGTSPAPGANLFRAFSDPSRITILGHLLLGEHRVSDLVDHLGLAQSTVSQHLSCLKGCGLVDSRAEGRSSIYSVSHPEATSALLASAELLIELTGSGVTRCPSQVSGAR